MWVHNGNIITCNILARNTRRNYVSVPCLKFSMHLVQISYSYATPSKLLHNSININNCEMNSLGMAVIILISASGILTDRPRNTNGSTYLKLCILYCDLYNHRRLLLNNISILILEEQFSPKSKQIVLQYEVSSYVIYLNVNQLSMYISMLVTFLVF